VMLCWRNKQNERSYFSTHFGSLQNKVAAMPRSGSRATTMEEFKKFVQITEGD
jgi:hypothetical protein